MNFLGFPQAFRSSVRTRRWRGRLRGEAVFDAGAAGKGSGHAEAIVSGSAARKNRNLRIDHRSGKKNRRRERRVNAPESERIRGPPRFCHGTREALDP